MTAKPRRTASAAHVSRLLGNALDHGRYRRSPVAGFTVTQHTPDAVLIEWHGNSADLPAAFQAITARLDGPYDVEATTTRQGTYTSFPVAVLYVTPGTPVAAVEGTEATADDVTSPSYLGRAPWETERSAPSYRTAAEARESIGNVLAEHGAATVDRATGVITLHVGKDRTERHTLTPSTPEQLAAHRSYLTRLAAHWTDQAVRDREEAERLTQALDDVDVADYRRTNVETRQRDHAQRAQRAQEAADKVQAALATLTEPTHEGPDPSHGGLTTHRGRREDCTGPDCAPSRSTGRRSVSERLLERLREIEGLYIPEGARLARAPGATRGDNRTQGAWVWTVVDADGTPVYKDPDGRPYAVGSHFTMTSLLRVPLAANPGWSGDVNIEPTDEHQQAAARA
ncbi:hypothetical protein [Streptomyces mirabilis]|uniref:hypothetical protein n=1 Tax=Streptomyces mirabilis TaxID=68239 RepID=UPI003675CF8D